MINPEHLITPFEVSLIACGLASLFQSEECVRTPFGKLYFISVNKGHAFIEIDDVGYPLKEGTFVYLHPGHMFKTLFASEDLRVNYILFQFDFLADFPLLLKADVSDFVGKHPCRQLCDEEYGLINRYFEFINDRIHDDKADMYVTKGLLFSMVLEVSRIYSGKNMTLDMSRTDELVDGFFGLLHKHFMNQREAKFYANKLCVSDKHLMRSVKNKTGMTVHFWISDFVIREAKMLLRATDMTVTEISERLNFTNSSFFARFFRRHTSMSPLAFRAK